MRCTISRFTIIFMSLLLINAGSPQSSTDNRQQKVNFRGTITTDQNKEYTVANIAIGLMYRQIPVYETQKANADFQIDNDPTKGIITRLDLSEIREIRPAQPTQLFSYTRKKGHLPINYVEIEVVSNDQKATLNRYFIETTRKITADEINDAGPIEKEIPLTALKRLVIESYEDRDAAAKKK